MVQTDILPTGQTINVANCQSRMENKVRVKTLESTASTQKQNYPGRCSALLASLDKHPSCCCLPILLAHANFLPPPSATFSNSRLDNIFKLASSHTSFRKTKDGKINNSTKHLFYKLNTAKFTQNTTISAAGFTSPTIISTCSVC